MKDFEEKLEEAQELIMRADSMLSYLWHRGYMAEPQIDDDLARDIHRLLVDLRAGV